MEGLDTHRPHVPGLTTSPGGRTGLHMLMFDPKDHTSQEGNPVGLQEDGPKGLKVL